MGLRCPLLLAMQRCDVSSRRFRRMSASQTYQVRRLTSKPFEAFSPPIVWGCSESCAYDLFPSAWGYPEGEGEYRLSIQASVALILFE